MGDNVSPPVGGMTEAICLLELYARQQATKLLRPEASVADPSRPYARRCRREIKFSHVKAHASPDDR
jgi:hypothetical protein